ncbi:MAG: GNAT family N-acetyltransferase [Spirochaetaceae bacterium]|jgi:ribosomal protein S18 acetylase RimI-like enzyme|nr:GNAT family N-acetyltransferase [Spirochaetaceae bacterium]
MADIVITLQEGKQENIEKYLSIFNECKHESYISHGEVLCGRATHNFKWTDDILAQMKDEFTDDLTSENYTVLEILRLGEIAGFAIIELYKPEKVAVLDDIMIAKDAQGKGIGTEALRLIEAYLQSKNFGILLLESGVKNKGAHEFFEKNGFTQVSVEYAKRLKT